MQPKYRSKYEATVAKTMPPGTKYEQTKIKFNEPAKSRTYTPDFELPGSGILVELKGIFDAADRRKHLLVREQHPELDIRILFQRASNPICKTSKTRTTYGQWCDKHGIIWAEGTSVPASWMI